MLNFLAPGVLLQLCTHCGGPHLQVQLLCLVNPGTLCAVFSSHPGFTTGLRGGRLQRSTKYPFLKLGSQISLQSIELSVRLCLKLALHLSTSLTELDMKGDMKMMTLYLGSRVLHSIRRDKFRNKKTLLYTPPDNPSYLHSTS